MSKRMKDLITRDYAGRLANVENALLVDVIGMSANDACALRKQLREKKIQLMVIKNSLARRATVGSQLDGLMETVDGSLAIVWGGEDIISLAKVVVALTESKAYSATLKSCGGVMEGEHLTAERVKAVSKWPSRTEMLSILSGQLLSPGAQLSAALLGPGGQLASQIEQIAEGKGPGAGAAEAADASA